MPSLQQLPAQVAALDTRVAALELQFLQFRAEVKEEFLTTRRELTRELGGHIDGKIDGLREELGAVAAGLREEMRTLNEETRLFMRILHEQLRADIRTMGEGR